MGNLARNGNEKPCQDTANFILPYTGYTEDNCSTVLDFSWISGESNRLYTHRKLKVKR